MSIEGSIDSSTRNVVDMWLTGVYLGGAVLDTFGDDVLDFSF